MKKIYAFCFLALALSVSLLAPTSGARAQEIVPAEIVSVNFPISSELRDRLTAWLQTSPPSSAVYYAVTYSQRIGNDHYVSMVGLNIEHPDDFWSLVGDEFGNQQVIWLDTIRVYEDGTITFPFAEQTNAKFIKVADLMRMPLPGEGGGAYVRFPWQPAKAVKYGLMGAHEAGFGTDGDIWGAVDLISGSDMGTGAANDGVYASVSGIVDYVCQDEDFTAVKLSGGGDSFLYAHLKDNANLVIDHSFTAGQLIGSLVHGSFTDDCGLAMQQDDHWHLHWGFERGLDGGFQAEGCFLSGGWSIGSLAKWKCGNTEIKVNEYLTHYGNISIDPNDGTVGLHLNGEGSGGGPSFWNYFIAGLRDIFDILVMNNLPEHEGNLDVFFTTIMNGVKIVFRIAQVLIRGNLNLAPAMMVVVLAISAQIVLHSVMVAGYIFRILKSVPGA